MRSWLALFLLLAAASGSLADLPVEVRARVEPDTVTIGTRFRYVVEVFSQPDTEIVVAQPAEKLGEFEIVDFGVEPPARREGRNVLRRWYWLVGYSPGHHLIRSPLVKYRNGSDSTSDQMQEASPAETVMVVKSVLAEDQNPGDIHDIKGPEPVPIDWRPYLLLGGAVAGAVAIALGVWLVWRRPRQARREPPPRPAHEVAAGELELLRQKRLVEQGAFKDYYSALSAIVRNYLERRFQLRAPEMTTEEFLITTARDGRLLAPHRRLLGEFLGESDLVKFARHLPTIADSERAYAAARRFVDETAPPPSEDYRAAS